MYRISEYLSEDLVWVRITEDWEFSPNYLIRETYETLSMEYFFRNQWIPYYHFVSFIKKPECFEKIVNYINWANCFYCEPQITDNIFNLIRRYNLLSADELLLLKTCLLFKS